MMADLVHQDVGDDVIERLVVLRPVVEDRTAIEEHHVGGQRRVADALAVERDTLIEAEEIKLGGNAEIVQTPPRSENPRSG